MQWWTERSARERLLIAIMALALIGVLGFQFGYKPLQAYGGRAERRLEAARALHGEVAQGAAKMAAMRAVMAERKPRREGTMRTTITVSAQMANITITRLEPQDAGLNVWINAVPMPALHGWVQALSRDYGITVRKATIRRQEDGAAVRAQLLFSEGSGT